MKKRTLKSFGWIVMFALLVSLVAPSTSWARRDRASCDDGGIGGCVNDVLDEEEGMIDDVEEMVEDVDGIIDDLAAMGLFSLDGDDDDDDIPELPDDLLTKVRGLSEDHRRAQETNDATTDDEYDDMLDQADQEKGKDCKKNSDMAFYNSLEDDGSGGKLPPPGYLWADMASNPGHGPPDLLGNNKCDVFDATYDDGSADGVPVTVNERSENMCEPYCKEKEVGGQSQSGKTKGRFLEGMQDVIISAGVARRTLSIQRAQISALRSQISELRLSGADFSSLDDPVDPCKDGTASGPSDKLDAIHALNITIVVFDGVLAAGNILTNALECLKDATEPPSQQDVAGFNASSANTPFVVAYWISKIAFDIVSDAKDIIDSSKGIVESAMEIDESNEYDYTNDCRKEIRDKTDLLQEDVDALQGATADLQESADQTSDDLAIIKDELARMKELLLTPQGKRDGFPSK